MLKTFTFLCFFLPVFVWAQAGTEIYIFDLSFKNNEFTLSNPINISQHKGYDNQPFFHPVLPIIYYASANDSGRTDIKAYHYINQTTTALTNTHEREYSPTVTPDGNFFSCIIQRDNGQQDLGKYPISGGEPIILIDNLKVGYHTWTAPDQLLLFVLADSANFLHEYNITTKTGNIIAAKPGRSLHKIPHQQAFSFVDKSSVNQWNINRFDVKTKTISPIVATIGQTEDIAWAANGYLFGSDGGHLYAYHPVLQKQWQMIDTSHLPMLKKITRLAINQTSNKIAIVVNE